MKILVSACLMGQKVRYDGKDRFTEGMEKLSQYHELLPFCPEVSGGLPVPREPAELNGKARDTLNGEGSIITSSGNDVTAEFLEGAGKALALCLEKGAEAAILKDGSPSCGSTYVYDGNHCGVKIPGMGITAELLTANGIRVFSEKNFHELFPDECDYVRGE